jgi:hypothetical protein
MKRSLLVVAACGVVLGGCGVGGVLALTAGGGGGGGGKKAPPPPRVELTKPPEASNFVTLSYELRDPQVKPNDQRPGGDSDPRVRVFPQFRSKTGVTWFDMTEAQVAESQGTRALPLGQHVFVWNTVVDLGPLTGPIVIRVQARYEDAEGIKRKFRAREVEFQVDNRLAATILGPGIGRASDVDTFPVDMRPDGVGFVVADLGANIVERVDALGQVERLAGFGVPGASQQDGLDPGVAKLPTLVNFDIDAAGNLYSNHRDRLLVTNRGSTPLVFGLVDGPDADSADDTVVVAPHTIAKANIPALTQSRCARIHPTGALLVTSQLTNADYVVLAVNPQDPASPASTPITLGATVIGPGETKVIVGGGGDRTDGVAGTSARVEDANAVAVGPDGEIYYVERSLSLVRVLNSTPGPLTIGGRVVASGAVDTVAGGGTSSALGDGGPARGARLSLPGSIDVSSDRVLFVADTNNFRVRAANLGDASRTFAGTTVDPSEIQTVVGGGNGAGGTGGVGSKATDLILRTPNAVTCVGTDELLVADSLLVILVNGGTGTVSAYGKTAGPARTATVYDATNRSGPPLARPRAAHIADARSTTVFFTDRTTVRVLNVDASPVVVGGAKADAGGTAIVGGGSVPGFSGDGGPARSAAFDTPSALATDGSFKLYVADTGNDRVRYVNVGDPLLVGPKTAFGVTVAAGNVDTIVGGAAGPLPADGDGLAPRDCSLSGPLGVAVSSTGLLFIADTGHHRIRCVNPGPADATVAGVPVAANTITTVVGGGVPGFTPDGAGPWLVDTPTALAVVGEILYFSEAGNARVRALNFGASVDPDAAVPVPPNEVVTIAGSGIRGNGGDGGLGPDARIDTAQSLFVVTKNGSGLALIFADGPQHVVRLVNLVKSDLTAAVDALGKPTTTVPGGSIVSLAGGPNTPGTPNFPTFAGDGAEAAAMRVSDPWGVVVTMKGDVLSSMFLMDQGNDRVRRVGAPPVRSSTDAP